MRRVPKIAVVAAVQVLVLLAIVAFGQYTVSTSRSVVLRITITNNDLEELDIDRYPTLRLEISELDPQRVAIDADALSDVWVELQQRRDGTWGAIAVHKGRRHTASGTVLMKATITNSLRDGSDAVRTAWYGLEHLGVSDTEGIPGNARHDVALEVQVNRFGHVTPKRFIIDTQSYPVRQHPSSYRASVD